jgi:hypothetical protein
MNIKVVIIIDAEGNYMVHGNSEQTPAEMFKTMSPLWNFDPSTEHVHYVQLAVYIPGTEHIETKDDYVAPQTDAS